MSYKILITSWNAGHTNIAAGGYVRMLEIFKRVPDDVELLIADTNPGVYQSIKKPNVHHLIYKIPVWIKSLEKISYNFERILEWCYSSHRLFLIALKYRHGYDLVYNPHSELLVTSWPSLLIKWFLRKKVVFMNMNANAHPLERVINRFIHRHIDQTITLSESLKQDLAEQKILASEINPVGIDLGPIERISEQEKKYDGIFIGRHTQEKGIFDLLDLTAAIVQKKPNFRLITLGSCDPEMRAKLESEIKNRQIEKNFFIKGITSDEEKYRLLKASRLCLFLSYREGWGIVPQEALACGLPVIAYDLSVYQEHIAQCPNVFLAPIGDWQTVVEKMLELLENKKGNDNKENKEKAKEFVRQFSWDKVAEKEFNLLKKLPLPDR